MSSKVLIINPKHPFTLGSPSLGIGYLLAYSRKMSDHSVKFLDENFIEKPDNEINKIIKEGKIDFVGISFPSAAIMRVIDICKLIREHFNNTVQIFAGGYHTTSEPELTLRFIPQLDFIIVEEAEHIVSKLDANWKKLKNVAYLENDIFKQNPVSFIKTIDEIPFPNRRDFDTNYFQPAYGVIAGIYGKVATIMSSRGCPYSCKFCSSKIIQKIVRYHSKNYVLSEIDHILSEVGNIDYLYFVDVMFLAKWSRIEELCNEFINNKGKVPFKPQEF